MDDGASMGENERNRFQRALLKATADVLRLSIGGMSRREQLRYEPLVTDGRCACVV